MSRKRTIYQRCITADDIPILLRWRNSVSFRHLCTKRKAALTESEFRLELQEDFKFDRREQIIIFVDGAPAGTAFAYRYSKISKHVFVSIFLEEQYRGYALGAFALAEFVGGIFSRLDLYKVYFEVYSYNKSVVRLLTRLGLSLEGEFKGHVAHGGVRHDLLIFALYRDVADHLCARLSRELAKVA